MAQILQNTDFCLLLTNEKRRVFQVTYILKLYNIKARMLTKRNSAWLKLEVTDFRQMTEELHQ